MLDWIFSKSRQNSVIGDLNRSSLMRGEMKIKFSSVKK